MPMPAWAESRPYLSTHTCLRKVHGERTGTGTCIYIELGQECLYVLYVFVCEARARWPAVSY